MSPIDLHIHKTINRYYIIIHVARCLIYEKNRWREQSGWCRRKCIFQLCKIRKEFENNKK